MFTPFKLKNGQSTGYGCGWMISEYEGHRLMEHGGGINGFAGHVLRLPEDRIYVAVLGNNEARIPDPAFVAMKIAALLLGKPLPEPGAFRMEPAALDAFVGVYEIDSNSTRTISRQGDRLFSQRSGGRKLEIFPTSDSTFAFTQGLPRITFRRDAGGKVTAMIVRQAAFEEQARRTDRPVPAEPVTTRVDPKLYDELAGDYELQRGFVITISRDGERLMAQATGQARLEIFPKSPTEFFYKVVDAQITFVKDPAGLVTGMILRQGGRDMPAPRLD
jgi:D-alanyl-D-alanine carboxypeptidase